MTQALYESYANELRDRIFALIPDNPGILRMKSPWDLFGIEGFKCDDLQPSMGQAAWALRNAQAMHESKSAGEPGGLTEVEARGVGG
jgi:hypothetical protein